jgi:hypothetical protein
MAQAVKQLLCKCEVVFKYQFHQKERKREGGRKEGKKEGWKEGRKGKRKTYMNQKPMGPNKHSCTHLFEPAGQFAFLP